MSQIDLKKLVVELHTVDGAGKILAELFTTAERDGISALATWFGSSPLTTSFRRVTRKAR